MYDSHTRQINNDYKQFIMFGCWNQGKCTENGTNPLSNTMRTLREYVSDEKTDFIIVAGDNYYPEKSKTIDKKNKKKIINTDNLNSGFQCLPDDIPTDIILGNHDLETNLTDKTDKIIPVLYHNENHPESGNCDILMNEKEIVKSKPNLKLQIYGMRMLGNDTMIIKFDTTMFDPDVQEYKKCYRKISKKNFDRLKNRQKNVIQNWVKKSNQTKSIRNIIFVGHHPLVFYKPKKGKTEPIIFDELIDFFASLDFDKKLKKYYLCADVHFHQKSIVSIKSNNSKIFNFEQHVVGTGGTELDDIPENVTDSPKNIKNVSISVKQSNKEHGFLVVRKNGKNVEFEFVKTGEPILEKTGGRKYTKKFPKKKRTKTLRKK